MEQDDPVEIGKRASEAVDGFSRAIWRSIALIYGIDGAAHWLANGYGCPTEGEVRLFEETLNAKILLRPDLSYEVRSL